MGNGGEKGWKREDRESGEEREMSIIGFSSSWSREEKIQVKTNLLYSVLKQ